MKFVEGTPDWVKPIIERESLRTGVPSEILSAQIKQESGFKPQAGSVAGARGISQFIASTARAYGLRVDNQVDERLDPEQSIRAQADYMRDLIQRHGTMERALSAYNSGNPDRYKDPSFKTWYGSVGETSKYVRNITNDAGLSGEVKMERKEPPKENKGILNKLLEDAYGIAKSPFSPKKAHAQTTNYTPNTDNTINYSPNTYSPNIQDDSYTVKKGDTLWGIAQNKLGSGNRWKELGYTGDPRQLQVGTKLKVPTPGRYMS